MDKRRCSVEGCVRPFGTRANGADYCDAHYNRLRRYGDPLAGGTFRVRGSVDNPCSFEGCDQRAKAKGLCTGHYAQVAKGIELRPLRGFNPISDGMKRCPQCQQILALDMFGKKASGATWLCKSCNSIYQRSRTYGISFDEAKAMIEMPCAGCGRQAVGRGVHIDHDHATGRVRGVLCHNCNAALSEGMTPEILRRLAYYLDRG